MKINVEQKVHLTDELRDLAEKLNALLNTLESLESLDQLNELGLPSLDVSFPRVTVAWMARVAESIDEGLWPSEKDETSKQAENQGLYSDAFVSPVGGNSLDTKEAAVALRQAMEIIQSVGTTGVHDKIEKRNAWMRKHFPLYDVT